jgi:hypothetical protein
VNGSGRKAGCPILVPAVFAGTGWDLTVTRSHCRWRTYRVKTPILSQEPRQGWGNRVQFNPVGRT